MDEPLPSALGDALRPVLPALAEEMIGAIGREVPEYARPLEGPFGRGLRAGVEQALGRFVETLVDPTADEDPAFRAIYVALGRGEMRAGRSLDALLSAYRLGARIAWERCVAVGQAAGFDPETLYRLATAIFSYIDRISAESVEGYAAEQSATLAERDVPDYIEADHNKSSATFTRTPTLTDVPYAVQMEPNLVIEFYSR